MSKQLRLTDGERQACLLTTANHDPVETQITVIALKWLMWHITDKVRLNPGGPMRLILRRLHATVIKSDD